MSENKIRPGEIAEEIRRAECQAERAVYDGGSAYKCFYAACKKVADYEERVRVLEAALRKACLRVRELSEFYYDLDDAPEGAVPAWDLVALAIDEASALAPDPQPPASGGTARE